MKTRLCLLALLLLGGLGPLPAEEPGAGKVAVVAQKPLGENACGPCTVLNALKFGGEAERAAAGRLAGGTDVARVQGIIEKFGHVKSDAYPERPRYREADGMCDREMLGMARDVLAEGGLRGVEGCFLDHTEKLPPGAHLRAVFERLRGSLDAGLPPMVLIRSFGAKEKDEGKDRDGGKKGGDPFVWNGLNGHWVAIVSLPKELPPEAISFTMRVADSWTGKTQECFVHEEQFRNFTAAKGDDRTYTWPKVPRPFLLVTIPGLPLGTQKIPWYLRTNVVLSYAVYRPAPGEKAAAK